MSETNQNAQIQNVIIENREKISLSGITDVISFDDETLLLNSGMGRITVKGESLKIDSFNTDSGDLAATGKVHAVVYMSDVKQGGFFSRLFA